MEKLVATPVLLLVALALTGCQTTTARIVDCAPGYHNAAGPASDCVRNSSGPTVSTGVATPSHPLTSPSGNG
jgi:hypothetical protein